MAMEACGFARGLCVFRGFRGFRGFRSAGLQNSSTNHVNVAATMQGAAIRGVDFFKCKCCAMSYKRHKRVLLQPVSILAVVSELLRCFCIPSKFLCIIRPPRCIMFGFLNL